MLEIPQRSHYDASPSLYLFFFIATVFFSATTQLWITTCQAEERRPLAELRGEAKAERESELQHLKEKSVAIAAKLLVMVSGRFLYVDVQGSELWKQFREVQYPNGICPSGNSKLSFSGGLA
jgi:hypothetical protein